METIELYGSYVGLQKDDVNSVKLEPYHSLPQVNR